MDLDRRKAPLSIQKVVGDELSGRMRQPRDRAMMLWAHLRSHTLPERRQRQCQGDPTGVRGKPPSPSIPDSTIRVRIGSISALVPESRQCHRPSGTLMASADHHLTQYEQLARQHSRDKCSALVEAFSDRRWPAKMAGDFFAAVDRTACAPFQVPERQ